MKDEIKIPKYQIIENDLIDMILQGVIKPDESIPSEANLQTQYNCSRVTVRQALSNLEYKGFIYKKRGSGSFVKKNNTMHKHPSLKSFTEDMIEMGKVPTSKISTFNITQAGDTIANLLNIDKDDRVYYIERTRLADDVPMMFERTFMSVDMHPDISMRIMENSKYQYAIDNGFELDYAHQRICPIFPSDYIADTLKISCKQPILRVCNTVYLTDGRVFDYTELYINTDFYQLDIIKKR